ncbi:MAG TPA: hypothetical protein VKY71_16335 [Actinotalea caeni]|uniref:hypothetical protein n=1 Tax=Actinotalea caeni TaxID=1348467 RepID=UPI0012E31425|nr:hypothetical protein [Actinotalea caeni]HLV57128.1 hypothetical protein [Actinotalea caeni]
MATELVLLSDVEVTHEHVVHAAADAHPDGTYVTYRGGDIGQLVDASARPLLTIFRSRPVAHPREAASAVTDPPVAFGLWTEMTIPYGDTGAGRAAAEAVAAAVGGVVKERV